MLKNIGTVELVIKYDGRQYPVEPGQTFDVKSMAPLGVISNHESICLEEKWEKETGGKLTRNVSEAVKAESAAPAPQEEVKPQPAPAQVAKPAVKKADSAKKRGKK